MKYSKEYDNIMNTDSFPPQWRESAIEYRKLKKLIKNVADELAALGLNPEVLHKILKPEELPNTTISTATGEAVIHSPTPRKPRQSSFTLDSALLDQERERRWSESQRPRTVSPGHEAGNESDIEELEFEVDELSDLDTLAEPSHGKRFRLRLPSHSSTVDGEPVNDAQALHGDHEAPAPHGTGIQDARIARVKAEYVLSGPTDKPTPEIRLFLSPSPRSVTPSKGYDLSGFVSAIHDDGGDGDDSSSAPSSRLHSRRSSKSSRRGYATESVSSESDGDHNGDSSAVPRRIIPSSPRLEKIIESPSPIFAISNGTQGHGMESLKDQLDDLDLGDAALDDLDELDDDSMNEPQITNEDHNSENSEHATFNAVDRTVSVGERKSDDVLEMPLREDNGREIVVSLPADVAFFQVLCQALVSLSELHAKQQQLFNTAVQHLCALVSSSIVPQSGGGIIRNIHLPAGKRKSESNTYDPAHTPGASSYHKSDLYVWREIFTLWIEAQIFESSAERDRGERSVEQADARLKAFASEVVKRGLGDRRTLRRKESREAWEEFLRLNVLLLDLKKFQIANINAARKILKKHDKRTALTASTGFPQFVRSSLDAHVDANGNVKTWAFYSTSLPHVLLTSLTETLLPILPSLEDYTCLICTSIAFKPIRLGCSHLFCVRCLAKMQRAGAAECPLCRARTVLQADRSSLDTEMQHFMEQWFPLEVKMKQKDNELEIARSDQHAHIGPDAKCRIM